MTYIHLAVALVVLGAIPATLFVFAYGAMAPWWRSAEGWNLFGFTLSIALLLDLSLAQHFAGPLPGLRVVALVIYAAIAGFLWQRLFLLLRAQRRGQDELQARRARHDDH